MNVSKTPLKIIFSWLLFLSCQRAFAQAPPPPATPAAPTNKNAATSASENEDTAEVPIEVPDEGEKNKNRSKDSFKSVDSDEEDSGESKPTRPRKFLILTLGVEHDEVLPPIPNIISFKGDYKNCVSVSYAKEIKTLRFNPRQAKICVLTIQDKTGNVVAEYRLDVKKSNLDSVMREIQALLGDIEGITFKIVNNRVVVDGQVLLPKDITRIQNVVDQYGQDMAATLVTMSPLAQKKIAEFISRDINNPEIEVRAVNDKIILQGVAGSQEEKDRAEIIAKTYMPPSFSDPGDAKNYPKKKAPANDGVINMITLKEQAPAPPSKIVQIVIHYVALNKGYEKAFNFSFSPGLSTDSSAITFNGGGSGTTGSSTGTSIAGTISNLFPKLNWIKTHSFGRVLESSSLIVKDGVNGHFESVTNYPFPVATTQGVTTQFEKVGITSDVKPNILNDRSDSISMDMTFSVSSLVGTNAATGAPISTQNKVQTSVIVRSTQSAAIGGLVSGNSSTSFGKPDVNNPNPIVSFVANKDYQNSNSQFVVFVTPVIKSSASAGSEKIKKKFRLRE